MSKFGYGEDTHLRLVGTTSSLGNNDGKTSTQVSFLGIEDFYGGSCEWMCGIHSKKDTYYIYDGLQLNQVPTVPYRTVSSGFNKNTSGWITKVKWGNYADLIPTGLSGGSSTTYYCDYGLSGIDGWMVCMRSEHSGGDGGGLTYFYSDYPTYHSNSIGSRLQYRGDIKVIEDPQEFINLPLGF